MAKTNGKDSRDVVIVGAARTPIGKFMGGLSSLSAPQLGAVAVRAAVERAKINPASTEEVLIGQVVSAGSGQAPARQVAIGAGLPASVGAVTVNKVCGSGLEAVMLAASAIKAGDGETYVAGGIESMSSAPYLVPNGRAGARYGHMQMLDSIIKDALWCPFEEHIMGNAAEFIADKLEVTREEMDELALNSHRKAVTAIDAGKFKAEIAPVESRTARAA